MSVFEHIEGDGYEQIVYCNDDQSGLKAIIVIHSTALGPALGGTRFYNYPTEEEALVDVLRLAKGMTYKAAAAGLDLGGGKGVIIGDHTRIKSEELLRAYGRFIETLGGRYITAEDVGTALEDMDTVRRETRWVTGCSHTYGGSGDPSPVTAYGVLQGQKACCNEVFGSPSLKDRTVALQGVGKVGHALCGYLVEEGAKVTIGDVNVDNAARAVADYGVETVPFDEVHKLDVDIFAPCALGAAPTRHHFQLHRLNTKSPPPPPSSALINAGGLINVEDELRGYDRERAMQKVLGIYKALQLIFTMAHEKEISTARAATEYAEERIRKVSRIRLVRVTEFGPLSAH